MSGVRLASTRMPVRCECFLSFSDDSFLAADLVPQVLALTSVPQMSLFSNALALNNLIQTCLRVCVLLLVLEKNYFHFVGRRQILESRVDS